VYSTFFGEKYEFRQDSLSSVSAGTFNLNLPKKTAERLFYGKISQSNSGIFGVVRGGGLFDV
jgi:hypothetical protein